MKIIVLGNGNAGKYLSSYFSKFYNIEVITRADIDAADSTTIYNISNRIHEGDIVINCIGVLKPNIKNVGVENTFKINGLFPNIMQRICKDKKSHFFHICSDCVFDGKRGNYTERDIPNAKDVYGVSKAMVKNGNIIRTSFIGEYGGLMKWVISNKDKNIDGYTNCKWNGVTVLELSRFIHKIIKEKLFWNGVYNLSSPEIISKYELCKLINIEYNLNITINKKIAKSIEGTTINGILDRSLKYKNIFDFKVKNLKEQLFDMNNSNT